MIVDPSFPGWPVTVQVDRSSSVLDYWQDRIWQHATDYYAGLRISKFPEDLRTYEHLLWVQKPNVVIEIGCQFGASSLWFADRLEAQARYGAPRTTRVVAIDIDTSHARAALDATDPMWGDRISLLEGDVLDPDLVQRVTAEIDEGASCMVVEDSAHEYATTLAALHAFNHFVPPEGFFVVEDGIVDDPDLRLVDEWPSGVEAAIHDFLNSELGAQFVRCPEFEIYGLTSHLGGYLQRRRRDPSAA
jgi:cephalosporin hydroxylase